MKATCLNCNKEFEHGHSSRGKYCSNTCQGVYQSNLLEEEFWAGKRPGIYRETARKYLANKRGYKCEVCGVSDWQGKKLTLHVDHINGDPSNNHPTNLRLICPNCHSQTPFLGAANKGRGRGSLGLKH